MLCIVQNCHSITGASFSIGMSPRLQLEQWCEHEFHQWLQQLQEGPQSS